MEGHLAIVDPLQSFIVAPASSFPHLGFCIVACNFYQFYDLACRFTFFSRNSEMLSSSPTSGSLTGWHVPSSSFHFRNVYSLEHGHHSPVNAHRKKQEASLVNTILFVCFCFRCLTSQPRNGVKRGQKAGDLHACFKAYNQENDTNTTTNRKYGFMNHESRWCYRT